MSDRVISPLRLHRAVPAGAAHDKNRSVQRAPKPLISNVNGEREPAAFPRMLSPRLTAKEVYA